MKKGYIFRAAALILSAVIALSALSGCGKRSVTDGAKSTEEELRAVGTIGNYQVCYDEYRYVVLSCKSILESKYGKDIWSTADGIATYSPMLEEMVEARITANYAVLGLCDANGFENALSDKDNIKYVDAKIENSIYLMALDAGYSVEVDQKTNGDMKYTYKKGELNKAKELFQKALTESYLTERVMRLTLGTEFAFSRLTEILTTEKNEIAHKAESIEAYMKSDKFICTKHVFIEDDGTRSRDQLLADAETVLSLYKEGKSMNYLIGSKYNKDISMPYKGYYFTHGEMDETYESAAFALEVGQVSDIVETEEGFYIIWRCEKDEDYMLTNLESFADQIVYALVNEKVRSYQDSLTIELTEFGRSLVLHEIAAN